MPVINLNALSPTTDIMSVANLVNQQIAGGALIAPEIFYSKQLLDTIRMDADQYVYYRLADAMPIQERADKLYIRRWSALQAHTIPLTEGVPPLSDKGSVKKYEMEAYQYGRFMEFTDKVNFKVVDPVVAHFAKEYSIVAIETLDLLAREALLLNAQKFYAGSALSPDDLTFASAPSMTDLRKIVLSLKKALVKPRNNGKFHVIGSPEFFYDMISDATVAAYMTINQTTKTMYDNTMLVPMFGMEFYETLVVPTSGEYVDENGDKRLKIYTGTIGSNPVIGVSDPTAPATLEDLIETDADQYSEVSGYVNDPTTGQVASYMPNQPTWNLADVTGAKEFKFQHILIVGKDALARTGMQGEDSAKMYTKPLGSSGVLDPIDQRQSIGFKINSVGFASVRPEAIVDYICVPSMVNIS